MGHGGYPRIWCVAQKNTSPVLGDGCNCSHFHPGDTSRRVCNLEMTFPLPSRGLHTWISIHCPFRSRRNPPSTIPRESTILPVAQLGIANIIERTGLFESLPAQPPCVRVRPHVHGRRLVTTAVIIPAINTGKLVVHHRLSLLFDPRIGYPPRENSLCFFFQIVRVFGVDFVCTVVDRWEVKRESIRPR